MSIARRADGRWLVRYKDRETGKWLQKTFKDEDTARAWEASYISANAIIEEDNRLTLGELVMLYFRSNPDKHPRTKRQIVYLLAGHENKHGEHIPGPCEFLRDKYADTLNRQDLERLREVHRIRGTSNNSINKYQAYIRAILAWGVDQDLIHNNPWRDYKLLKVKKPMIRVNVDDLKRLYPFLPQYMQWAVKTAFFLALRPGLVELFGLTWDAFDWRRKAVFVRQGKSGKIKMVIPHPDYMREAQLRCTQDMAAGIPWVCHRTGSRVLSYKSAWNCACKKAGVSMRLYDIRHIAATEMLARGADLAAVAAQLGHGNVATTGAYYAHVTARSQQAAATLMPPLENKKE